MNPNTGSTYFRRDSERLIDMEQSVRAEFGVELCFIQNGAFFEAYGESAFTAGDALDYQVSTNAHGWSMTGFPVAGLETLLERMKNLGLTFAIVEQMGDSARRGRKIRAVTHIYPESPQAKRNLPSRGSRTSSPVSEKQRQAMNPSQPGRPRAGRPLKAMASTSDGITTILSPDGEILRRIPPDATASIEWFIREESKRLNYPRHGARWDDAEDQLLRDRVAAGATVSQLAAHHQRTPGGIRSRLAKLGLEDDVRRS